MFLSNSIITARNPNLTFVFQRRIRKKSIQQNHEILVYNKYQWKWKEYHFYYLG